MGNRFASFLSLFGVCTLLKSKILKTIYWMSIFQWRLDGFSQKYISLYLYLGLFSKTGKTRVSHRVKMMTRWQVTQTWKMTQMTHWPGDSMTQFHVCLVCSYLKTMQKLSHFLDPLDPKLPPWSLPFWAAGGGGGLSLFILFSFFSLSHTRGADSNRNWYTPCTIKGETPYSLWYLYQILTDFQKSLSGWFSSKFVVRLLKIPLHLAYVSTLPCEILLSEKWLTMNEWMNEWMNE